MSFSGGSNTNMLKVVGKKKCGKTELINKYISTTNTFKRSPNTDLYAELNIPNGIGIKEQNDTVKIAPGPGVICYDVTDRSSFLEIQPHLTTNYRLILVALKCDIVLSNPNIDFVSSQEGISCMKTNKLYAYVEVSTKLNINVSYCFSLHRDQKMQLERNIILLNENCPLIQRPFQMTHENDKKSKKSKKIHKKNNIFIPQMQFQYMCNGSNMDNQNLVLFSPFYGMYNCYQYPIYSYKSFEIDMYSSNEAPFLYSSNTSQTVAESNNGNQFNIRSNSVFQNILRN